MRDNKMTAIVEKLIWIMIGILILAVYAVNKAEDGTVEARYGIPVIYNNKDELESKSIDQIADDGERIYLLLDDHDGIVQVYDSHGEYFHSIAFYKHLNGAFRIAVEDGILYVCDKQGNLYLFSNGTFIDFVDYKSGATLRKNIDFECNSTTYVLQGGSVWHIAGESKVCVISRSATAMLYQGHLLYLLSIGLIIFLGILRAIKQRRKHDEGHHQGY